MLVHEFRIQWLVAAIAAIMLGLTAPTMAQMTGLRGSNASTTGTLVIQAGSGPGEYRIGPAATLKVSILRPDVNRTLQFETTRTVAGGQLLRADRGQVLLSQVSPAALAGEASVNPGTNGLLIIELTSSDAETSPTVNREGLSVQVFDGVAPVFVQVDSTQALRSLIPGGVRIVTPLRAATKVRFAVGRKEMEPNALRGLQLSRVEPHADAPSNELASAAEHRRQH